MSRPTALTPFQTRAKRALSGHPFFGTLPDEYLGWTRRLRLRKGETLFEKGDASRHLFGLVDGQVKLCSLARTGPAPEACNVAFEIRGAGEMVGELGIARRAPRHATALGLANCEFAVLDDRDVDVILARAPELHASFTAVCGESALRLAARIEEAATMSAEERVIATLTDCARRFGVRIEPGATRLDLRQQDLADVLGLSRGTVNKILTSRDMRSRVRLGRGRIVLLSA